MQIYTKSEHTTSQISSRYLCLDEDTKLQTKSVRQTINSDREHNIGASIIKRSLNDYRCPTRKHTVTSSYYMCNRSDSVTYLYLSGDLCCLTLTANSLIISWLYCWVGRLRSRFTGNGMIASVAVAETLCVVCPCDHIQ